MNFKAVIFDLGGTLLHYHDKNSDDPKRPFRLVTLAGIRRIYERLVREGHPLPQPDRFAEVVDQHIRQSYRAAVQDLRGGTIEIPIRAAFAEVGVELQDGQWSALRQEFYGGIDEIVLPRSGLKETLSGLQARGLQLGLISNTFWAADLHDRHLAEHHILEYLPLRIYSCDVPRVKPHPSVFAAAIDRLNITPGEAVYVGDRPDVDIQGAQKAGWRGILIRSPYLDQSLGDVVPDAIIDELADLIPALEQLS
jgi:putative hydrolase of the HAD superfamily